MRATVDLPPAVHRRARELAQLRGTSVSSVVADLAVRGLAALGEPLEVRTDATSGLPVISLGRPVSAAEVADALHDD